MLTTSDMPTHGPSKKTNYWRRTQFLLAGIYGLLFFAATVFFVVQLFGE